MMRRKKIVRGSICTRSLVQFLVCGLAILTAPSFSGCGGKEGPSFGQVTGKVTLDGQPVQAGIVMFIPDLASGTTGPASQAQISSEGQYELAGPGGRKGALVGTHLVTVAGPEVSSDSSGQPGLSIKLPERYKYEQSSGIKKEVLEGENTIDIELSSSN